MLRSSLMIISTIRLISFSSVKIDAAFEKAVNEVYASIIDPSMTDFQKVYAFNKYIVNHVTYDFDNYMNNTVPK